MDVGHGTGGLDNNAQTTQGRSNLRFPQKMPPGSVASYLQTLELRTEHWRDP